MIKRLLDNIYEIIEEIDGIGAVYDYNATKADKYPCVVVRWTSFSDDWITNASNLQGYVFTIQIYQEAVIEGKRVSYKDIFIPFVEKVIDEFSEKWDGNLWTGNSGESSRIWSKFDGGNSGIVEKEGGDMLFAEFNLIINLTKNI